MADIDQIIAGGAGASTRADFSGIADIPEAYWKGKDRRYVQEGRDLFKGGIPMLLDKDGNPTKDVDWAAVSKKIIGHGDIGQGVSTENVGIARDQLRLGAEALKQSQGYETGQPPQQSTIVSPPSPNRSASTPVAPPLNRGGVQSGAGSPQGDQPGSLIGFLAANGVPEEEHGSVANIIGGRLAQATGRRIDPNAPLDMSNPQVRQVLAGFVRERGGAAAPQAVSADPNMAPANSPGIYGRDAVMTGGPPPPVAAQPPVQAQPLRPQGQPPPVTAASTGTTAPDIPSRIDQGIALYGAQMANPALPESVRKAAEARLKFLQSQKETTPEQKHYIQARLEGFKGTMADYAAYTEARKTTATEDAKIASKRYESLVETGVKAQREIPQLSLLQEQMNDPNFFSGVGEKYNLLYKRLKSAVGIDPEAAVPQELLRKVMASNVLSSFGELKGLGPIRVAEIKLAQTAAAAPDNSIPANKILVEISKRTHERNAEIADMAQEYKAKNGTLDSGFDRQVTDLFKRKPMISDAEIKDWHKLIGEEKAKAAPQPTTTATANPYEAEMRRRGLLK